jgi:hypothetical protein
MFDLVFIVTPLSVTRDPKFENQTGVLAGNVPLSGAQYKPTITSPGSPVKGFQKFYSGTA